jgi:tetratricopeptide (TPR) repeat protein
MESTHLTDAPLQDYPERSVWTTWAISYQAIHDKHEHTAKLLLLWSFLDNKSLWYGLFAEICSKSVIAARMLSEWIGKIASSELAFSQAMQLLRNYSLIEEIKETEYATHPVVHQWAYHYQGKQYELELGHLAVVAVGWAVPERSRQDYSILQQQLMPHAQACSWRIVREGLEQVYESTNTSEGSGGCRTGLEGEERETLVVAMNYLANLYKEQGKLAEAEQMLKQALQGIEETLGTTHISTLTTVSNLGTIYRNQGKLVEAEQMYKQALQGKKETLGSSHVSTLYTINNLGILYTEQGKLAEAEQMYKQALQGKEETLGSSHISTLNTVNNLGLLYTEQGKLAEAEQVYKQVLQGREETLGSSHVSTLNTVNNLGLLYIKQDRLAEAEQMFKRALQGDEKTLGSNHTSTLVIVNNLGIVYKKQGKLVEAEQMYKRALQGYKKALGDAQVRTYRPALDTLKSMGTLYMEQGDYTKARSAYTNALSGFQSVLGPSHSKCCELSASLEDLSRRMEREERASELEAESSIPGSSSRMDDDDSKDEKDDDDKKDDKKDGNNSNSANDANNGDHNAKDNKGKKTQMIKKTSRGWELQPAASQTASSSIISIPHRPQTPSTFSTTTVTATATSDINTTLAKQPSSRSGLRFSARR